MKIFVSYILQYMQLLTVIFIKYYVCHILMLYSWSGVIMFLCVVEDVEDEVIVGGWRCLAFRCGSLVWGGDVAGL